MKPYKSKFSEAEENLTTSYLNHFVDNDSDIREDLKEFVKKHQGYIISIGNRFIDKYEDLDYDDVEKIMRALKERVEAQPNQFPLIVRLFFGDEL